MESRSQMVHRRGLKKMKGWTWFMRIDRIWRGNVFFKTRFNLNCWFKSKG